MFVQVRGPLYPLVDGVFTIGERSAPHAINTWPTNPVQFMPTPGVPDAAVLVISPLYGVPRYLFAFAFK